MKRVKGARITFEECQAAIGLIPISELNETQDFVTDEHFKDWKYWIGWRAQPNLKGEISEAALRQENLIALAFTFKNVIGANLNRIEGTILGNEPMFNVIPVEAKTTVTDSTAITNPPTEAEKFYKNIDDQLVTWWTQKGIHQIFKNHLRAKAAFGKTAILTYIPNGFLEEVENVETKQKKWVLADKDSKFEDVLRKICVEIIDFDKVIDCRDEEFGTTFSVVKLSPLNLVDRFAVFYVDAENKSCFRIVSQNDTVNSEKPEENTLNEISCDLAGNNLCLTVGEYNRALVTPSVKKLQKALNHALTSEQLAYENINYPETTFLNAAPIEEVDANGQTTGKTAPVLQGAGVIRWLVGKVQESVNGMSYATPAVHERAQADPEKFSKGADNLEKRIDSQMGMGFKSLADSEYASGDSKEKSMDDYDILTLDYETSINTIGTKIFENVIRLVFFFTGQSNRNNEFNVLFRVNVSTGKITNEDRNTAMAEVAAELRSKENYMNTFRVTDNPQTEFQKIKVQPKPALEPNKPKQLPTGA